MFLTICKMCEQGNHSQCQKGLFPGEGRYGGWKCTCPCNDKGHWVNMKEHRLICDHNKLIGEYCSECHTEHKRSVKT